MPDVPLGDEQRIMRHVDYRTPFKHYTVLGLADTAKAMKSVPRIGGDQEAAPKPTGTTDDAPARTRQ